MPPKPKREVAPWTCTAASMDENDENDLVYIPVPRNSLRRLASNDSMLSSLKSSGEDWAYLGQAIEAMEKSAVTDEGTFPIRADNYYRSSSHSNFSSVPSSPTLQASSSRAASSEPGDLEFQTDEGDEDMSGVPVIDLDLGEDSAAAVDPGLPTRGTKRNGNHLDAPPDRAPLAFRGGAVAMAWHCPRAGNRKPLARQHTQMQTYGGVPMVHGPDGPEIDPEIENAEARGNTMAGGGIGDGVDGGEETDDLEEEEAPPKLKRTPKDKGKKRARAKEGDPEWVNAVRKHRTSKESVDLMASFSAMSSQRHHQNLLELISDICLSAPSASSGYKLPPAEASGLDMLGTLSVQVDGLIRQAKVLDFRRMIALMQLALWVDWLGFFFLKCGANADVRFIRQVQFVRDKNGNKQNLKQIHRDSGIQSPAYNTLRTWQTAGVRLLQVTSGGE